MTRVIQACQFPVSDNVMSKVSSLAQLTPLDWSEVLASDDDYSSVWALVVMLTQPVTAEHIAKFPNLEIICNYGAGYNNIDIQAATEKCIKVTNTPDVLSEATAELAWALMLAVARRVVESDKTVRAGEFTGWAPEFQLGKQLTGKTLGILGMGSIGQAVARRASGFEMKVVYHNRSPLSPADEAAYNATYVSFDELIKESDVLSLHTPLTSETRHLINKDTLLKMKPDAILINTARGPVVDEAALVEVLESGHLFGAGLDVYENEPAVHPGLNALDNVVLCAHLGSATLETRQAMGDLLYNNLLDAFEGRQPSNWVNPS